MQTLYVQLATQYCNLSTFQAKHFANIIVQIVQRQTWKNEEKTHNTDKVFDMKPKDASMVARVPLVMFADIYDSANSTYTQIFIFGNLYLLLFV